MGTVPPALPLLLLAQPAEDPVASDPEVSRLGATPDRDRIRESAYPEEFGVPGHCRMPAALPRGADESADNMSGPGYDCHGRPVLDRARAHCGDGGHSRARAPRTPPAPPLAHPQDAAATAIGSYCSASVHLRDLRRPSCSSSSTRNRSGRQGGQSTAPSCRSRRPRVNPTALDPLRPPTVCPPRGRDSPIDSIPAKLHDGTAFQEALPRS